VLALRVGNWEFGIAIYDVVLFFALHKESSKHQFLQPSFYYMHSNVCSCPQIIFLCPQNSFVSQKLVANYVPGFPEDVGRRPKCVTALSYPRST